MSDFCTQHKKFNCPNHKLIWKFLNVLVSDGYWTYQDDHVVSYVNVAIVLYA